MNAAAGAARSEDISSLKEAILSYAAVHSPEGVLRPQINSSSSKSDTRGFNHPMLARLLCPIQYLAQFDENLEQYVSLTSVLITTTHLTLLGTRGMQDLQEARIPFTSDDFPAFLYAADSYDPDNMEKGLLRHEFPLAVSLAYKLHMRLVTLVAGWTTCLSSTVRSVTRLWNSSCNQTWPGQDARLQDHDTRCCRIHHSDVFLGHLLAKRLAHGRRRDGQTSVLQQHRKPVYRARCEQGLGQGDTSVLV